MTLLSSSFKDSKKFFKDKNKIKMNFSISSFLWLKNMKIYKSNIARSEMILMKNKNFKIITCSCKVIYNSYKKRISS